MNREAYIKEMRHYYEKTRGSSIPGTKTLFPDGFDEKMGDYYNTVLKPMGNIKHYFCSLCDSYHIESDDLYRQHIYRVIPREGLWDTQGLDGLRGNNIGW